jgi:carbamoyl-phosphate synthase small subunit
MNNTHNNDQHGRLVLIDGQAVEGISFGAKKSIAGEVVFNTGMVGYPEALTDPSYSGQILVLTTPMVGNYGVPADSKDENGLLKFFEGEKIHIAGLIVTDYSIEYSHWNAAKSLSQWLIQADIPALYGIDTRKLTKFIRQFGAVLGKIEFPNQPIEFSDPNHIHLVREVSTKVIKTYGEGRSPRIIAYDCGMKLNIVRYFVNELKVCFIIVPFDYNLETNPDKIQYDGIFVSNGPGDPTMCVETINSIRWAISQEKPKPIFGICLGNQLLALACGAKTYKMKYGNRGMNQPCIDLRTTKCFITSQNHGFAVDNNSLPEGWKPLFLNANDLTNEGIIHSSKPFFSCQFHPEAAGGPLDTVFLFQDFIDLVKGKASERVLVSPSLYDRSTLRKVLLIGSGGLSIGQAGEFDYSGSQAIKALKEEGLEVILINPNIATVQTSKGLGRPAADKVYFLPIKPHVVEEIIAKERPDGVLVSMGGQTALNVGVELWKKGVFQKYNCRVLGTPIDTIIATEDREIFSQKLNEINERLAVSYSATTLDEAVTVAHKIGFPVLVRAAFALGGLGSGFADNEAQLRELAEKAFAVSDQILVDQDLRGWKEIEYEVVRDNRDNCITVCNMENFDPLGVHTGDSIVIAPSQTLSNSEYFKLRAVSIKVIRSLGIVGECNIQYALNPNSEEYCIVEVNARLSRSSALASKATGYPLAYVAAKLCLGKDLVSIRNSINKTTTACFEPSLDYCVVKVPRWDLSKFNKVSTKLGSSMLSVGEVMAIGKTFEEAIQKAVRMVSGGGLEGLEGALVEGKDLQEMIRVPTDKRLFAIQYALEKGMSVDEISHLSKIDRWFLSRLKRISDLKAETKRFASFEKLSFPFLKKLKVTGFSDRQIARYVNVTEQIVRRKRQQLGIIPFAKQIDTLAAEFPAQTNYLYMTYNGAEHDVCSTEEEPGGGLSTRTTQNIAAGRLFNEGVSQGGVMVLGCGAYSIGSSVEFDWCAVSAVRTLRAMGDKAIVVNYNPETVSTDYDESDKLYFEELTFERVLDIYELEKSIGIMVSVGGQIPNNLAYPLAQQGVRILGTSPDSIDKAEDRHKFSHLLDKLKIDQPEWKELTNFGEATGFADKVGYPVLVRPSFVLSGAAMRVASTSEELVACLQNAEDVSCDKPVVISKFIVNAKEIEFDAVAQDGHVLNYAISEHVENAGVHSGDATLLLPAQKLYVQTVRTVKQIASQIAMALKITGPFNIQFLAKDNMVKVIECNLRASRTFPFISKTFDCNFITLATKVMMGYPCKPYNFSLYGKKSFFFLHKSSISKRKLILFLFCLSRL